MGDKKARILVIDDEEGMRHSLDMLLSHLGYQVATAHTCRAGIERLGHEHFDVVLTDIVTPEGLGFEVMGYVRIHCPRTRVIAVTAYASQDSAIEALRHTAPTVRKGWGRVKGRTTTPRVPPNGPSAASCGSKVTPAPAATIWRRVSRLVAR